MGDLWNALFGSKNKPGPRVPEVESPAIPTRPAGPSIPQPGSTPATTTGPVLVDPILPPGKGVTADGKFVALGSPEDTVGNPALARTVDVSASEFKILGHAKLYAPGDTVQFYVKAITKPDSAGSTSSRQPVADLPVIVRNKQQARLLAGPVRTDAKGEATLPYVVTDADMSGDLSTPEPDSGSWLCNAYVGGRLLNQVVPLWDIA